MATRMVPFTKTLALVAHDNCKDDLVKWVKKHENRISNFDLVATGTTGEEIQNAINKSVTILLGGPYGGDQQLGSLIAEGKVNMIIFLWDALEQQAHDNDVKALQRLAVLWNIPLACNIASADFMITSPLMDSAYEINVPNI